MEELLKSLIEESVEKKVFPGCIVGTIDKKGNRTYSCAGRFTYDQKSSPVTTESIYDLASITKSIPTASIAIQLIEEGKISLDNLYSKYIPEFSNNYRDSLTIKHLLTYSIPGYGLASIKEKGAKELINILLKKDFTAPPGSVFQYTNIPAALLGILVECIEGKTIDQSAKERFFDPLGMHTTSFSPEELSQDSIVPTEIDDWRGEVRGVVHDESAYIIRNELRRVTGHAGLFSTTDDLLTFTHMLLQKGEYKGKRFFTEDSIAMMHTNQLASIGECTGLGWELFQPRYMGKYAHKNTFGKTGFTGTRLIIDPDRGVACSILSNRIYPKRPKDSSAINSFTASALDIILGQYG